MVLTFSAAMSYFGTLMYPIPNCNATQYAAAAAILAGRKLLHSLVPAHERSVTVLVAMSVTSQPMKFNNQIMTIQRRLST
jgi:hypothetical protein